MHDENNITGEDERKTTASPTTPAQAMVAAPAPGAAGPLFQAPEFVTPPRSAPEADESADVEPAVAEPSGSVASTPGDDDDDGEGAAPRRRRRRGGRGRRRKSDDTSAEADGAGRDESDEGGDESPESNRDTADGTDGEAAAADSEHDGDGDAAEDQSSVGSRRRRRRRRKGDGDDADSRSDDPPNTVVKVRDPRDVEDEVTKVTGSTRLEAKKQRRREGREAGRRRAPVISESEFLARREAVERVMAVRQSGDLTQIAVLEDGVLVEHYVSRASDQPLIGNVYLG